ncbi:MAG: HlyD family efflux transporter periplasmic adaptor subunit [Acutalibacteraceae bacterium]|nr:HlyD family efflux transporter periplasmic adaptor subunit [Acutalibacteraceae bacterium]
MKKSSNKLKYIIPILIAVILTFIFVSMLTSSFSMVYVEPAQYETVAKTLDSKAYIIRKESYITNDMGGVLYYNVSDSESIAANGVIANIYETETDAINITKINSLNTKIDNLKKLNSMSQVMGVSLESINKSLNNKLTEFIIDTQNNDFSDSSSAMEGLLYSLNEKQIITGEVTDFNEKIAELENERNILQQSVKPATGQILSPVAGIFTSYTDGFETAYDYANVSNLTYAECMALQESTLADVPKNVIGKVIADVNWYICCPMTTEKAKEFKELDDLVDVDIPYASADTLTARVVAVNDDAATGNSVVILECENMNSTLAQIREEKVNISVRDYYGIKIDKSDIYHDTVTRTVENTDGTTKTEEKTVEGVYILYGNELKFKEIVKLYETEDFVICDTDQENEDLFSGSTVKLYDKIVTEGTDLYAGKIVKQSTEVE